MNQLLPHPGHTWSFTQHAVGLSAETLYNFLKCAAPFEGLIARKYSSSINDLIINLGILTPNIRNSSPDAWRDYQQILAEIGLIYSTRLIPELILTDIGHLYLSGEINFSELISMQALRYQYPNGQKSVIQSRLRKDLSEAGKKTPESLIELQADSGLLIKPGVLILRILIELKKIGLEPTITVNECQVCILPCKKNSEWPQALQRIIAFRNNPKKNSDQINKHSRRNFQDWFKFLVKSYFFEELTRNEIKLGKRAIENISWAELCCEKQEDPVSFWIPTDFETEDKKSWFNWFGSLDDDAQLVLNTSSISYADLSEKITTNEQSYNNLQDEYRNQNADVNLKNLDLKSLERDPDFNFSNNMDLLIENLKKGAEKRHAKTVLHDRIIKKLADRFISQGAKIKSDPNTIDLYASWPNGHSAIFEVKTVTRKSLQNRLRLAIGQIEEYSYRRKIYNSEVSDRVIVINTIIPDTAWQKNFLTQHLNIGLICDSGKNYKAFAPTSFHTKEYWSNKEKTNKPKI